MYGRRGSFDPRQSNHRKPYKKPNPTKGEQRIHRFRAMAYAVYLKTTHWRKTRDRARRFYQGKCCRCGSTHDLQVHHRNYYRLGKERMSDLELLCRGCHENEHEGDKFGVFDPMTREFLSITKPNEC